MIDSTVGHTDKNGLDLWIAVNHSTQVRAHPSQIAGDVVLHLGDSFGQGLTLQLPHRIADLIVDQVVDALEAARFKESQKLEQSEGT